MKRIDWTGHKIGKLTVVSYYGSLNGSSRWLCRCVCGKERLILAGNIKHAHNFTSCGCSDNPKLINLKGQQFGNLTVLKREKNDSAKNTRWACVCVCGNKTISTSAGLRSGRVKSCGCWKARKGETHWKWKGGRSIDGQGYVQLTIPDHPNARKNGRIFEHIVVMSKILERPLFINETVHHKNGNRSDNRKSNLELKVSNHGRGQTIQDSIKYATEILKRYSPSSFATGKDVTDEYR
jgi:hypothetical protein